MDNTSEDFQYDTFDAGQRSQEIEDALDGSESASGTYKDIYGCYPFYLDLFSYLNHTMLCI